MYLLDVEGNKEAILGEPIEIENDDNFLAAMNKGDTMVTIGMEEDESSVLLYRLSVGYPENAGYPLPNGNQCTALLVGILIENLTAALSLGEDDSLIFTSIVRSDGTYVVNNSDLTYVSDSPGHETIQPTKHDSRRLSKSSSRNEYKLGESKMSLNEEFMQSLLVEIRNPHNNLLILHECLIKSKNIGMDKDSMIKNLEELRNNCDAETEDVLLEMMV